MDEAETAEGLTEAKATRRDLPEYMYLAREAKAKHRDTLAIPALLCGIGAALFALTAIPAVVMGIVSLRRSRRESTTGRPAAVAAIALGIVWVVVWAAIGWGAWQSSHHTQEVRIAPVGRAVGNCGIFANRQFEQVPCDKAHTAQLVANFVFPPGPYPGEQQVNAEASRLCAAKAQPYLSGLPHPNRWQVTWAAPQNPAMWSVNRYFSCFIETGSPITLRVRSQGAV